MKLTDALRAEHVVFHTLFDGLQAQAPSLNNLEQIRTTASLLASVLSKHGIAEDELLNPLIDPYLEELGQEDNFHHEHHAIDDNLMKIVVMDSVEDARRLLRETVQLAREHFDKEERIIFPLAEKYISEESLLALGKQWEELRGAAYPLKSETA